MVILLYRFDVWKNGRDSRPFNAQCREKESQKAVNGTGRHG